MSVRRDDPMSNRMGGDATHIELAGGGELGARMRAHDWSKTPLGPVDTWPQVLRSLLSMLLPSKAQIILFWGPEFTVFYNDAYRPVFGAKHPDALGRPGREAWSEIWDTLLHDLLAGVVRTGEAFWGRDLLFMIERHGFLEETYFDVSYDPVRVESGGVGGVYCIVAETTERVVGERRMALLKDLAAQHATARTTREACVLAMQTLAARPKDVVFALVYLDDELQSCTPGAEATLAAADRDAVRELPIPSRGADGPAGRLVVGVNPRLPFDDQYRAFLDLVASQLGTLLASARAHEDERKRAEALAEIDRAKTAFFSNVSHELRTPLTLILGPVEDMLTESRVQSAADYERIALVHRNSLRLLKLVNTLLDFSRLEAGRVQATFQPTDLSALTSDLASAFRSAIERAGMTLAVDCPPLAEPVYVDRDMWEKIVLNLVSNAFKYTLEGGITVSMARHGDRVTLSVRDTGVGIPATELPRLFERFHRVEGIEGRTHEGTGIGLALVQELVRLHGGSVTVESAPGRGSVFTVAIPLGHAHLSAERVTAERGAGSTALGSAPYVEEALRWLPDTPAQAVPPSGVIDGDVALLAWDANAAAPRARILLADDNADMRDYVRRLLGARYDVEAVSDGEAALRAARRNRPDLILADVMMPRLDGFGLLRELRGDADLTAIPVVMLSARAGEEARVEGWDAGADDYLVKPFSARELVARVESHLNLTRVRRQAAEALRLSFESEQQARTEAERASRLKDEFLTMLSHELRTPLNAILGWSQLLSRGVSPAENVQQGLATIERNARIQVQLIEDLLDISRITEGKLRLDVQRVSMCEVVEAALVSLRPAVDAKQIRVQKLLDCDADRVNGDPGRLHQVVWNLLSNAVKFTPKGGRIQVLLEREDSHVTLSISDNGDGIPADFLPHVFERFRQADQTTTRTFGGLGLGLSIVKHLVELHGGTVRAASAGKGQGATFVVELPLSLDRRDQVEGEDASAMLSALDVLGSGTPLLTGVTVLYVDDEPDARELVRRVLGEHGAQVTLAESAAEARRFLAAERPDVLVADIGMPEEDGYSLIRSIRALAPEAGGRIPAAAVTALARSEDRRRALLAGFQTHVAKPVDVVELVAVVGSLAGRTGRLRADGAES